MSEHQANVDDLRQVTCSACVVKTGQMVAKTTLYFRDEGGDEVDRPLSELHERAQKFARGVARNASEIRDRLEAGPVDQEICLVSVRARTALVEVSESTTFAGSEDDALAAGWQAGEYGMVCPPCAALAQGPEADQGGLGRLAGHLRDIEEALLDAKGG